MNKRDGCPLEARKEDKSQRIQDLVGDVMADLGLFLRLRGKILERYKQESDFIYVANMYLWLWL